MFKKAHSIYTARLILAIFVSSKTAKLTTTTINNMKTITMAACMLAAAATLTSCGKGENGDSTDTLLNKKTSDSICAAYGTMAGGYIGNELNVYSRETGEEYSHEEFLKGIQAVIGQERSEAYLAGLSTGLRVAQDIKGMQTMGVQVNRDEVLKALRAQLLADSIDMKATENASMQYQQFMQSAQQAVQERADARAAQSPEAVKNLKTGQAAVNRLAKENPNFHVTDDGMGYIIQNPGTGDKPTDKDVVIVNYTGKLLDGKEFDKNDNSYMNLRNVVPGFRKALEMLGTGGKGTFYIPAKLAYGVKGVPQAGIGPNMMLVFDIEVVKINNPGLEKTADVQEVK